MAHFDTKEIDALYRWSSRRSGDIAVANVSAARQAGSGYGSSYGSWGGYMNSGMYSGFGGLYGPGMYGAAGGWFYNPYFGMFTYMPYYGTAWSPFGYAYYTPITVVPVYAYAPRQSGPPVAAIGRAPGAPRVPHTSVTTIAGAAGRMSPAFTTNAAMHSGAVTRGAVAAPSRTGHFGGGSGYYSGGGYSSNSSYASSSASMSPSVSSAPMRSGGGGGGSAPMGGGGGGGGTRGH